MGTRPSQRSCLPRLLNPRIEDLILCTEDLKANFAGHDDMTAAQSPVDSRSLGDSRLEIQLCA
jgi:hypothetical protein